MRSIDVEVWTIKIIDNVLAGKPNEDSRVELKAIWPEEKPKHIARQLAAHANASRGEPILWIIGVNQRKREVQDAQHLEVARWYEKIKACFVDQEAPVLQDLNINYEDKTVVALLFDTERFPFLIKHTNEIFEVPWREGTLTRSAKRLELLKLLIPYQLSPRIELLSGSIMIRKYQNGELRWILDIQIYIEPANEQPLYIPFRRCEAGMIIANENVIFEEVKLAPPYSGYGGFMRNNVSRNLSKTIENSPDELLVYGQEKRYLELTC